MVIEGYNWKHRNFYHFHQFSPCTRGCLVDTCTRQHSMQEDTSSPLTELLDGGTILMDACKIQGLNNYFEKRNDICTIIL